MTLKSTIFWNVMPCSLVEIYVSGPLCLLSFLFHPDDGGSMFLQNTGKLLPNCVVSLPRRQYSSNGNIAFCLDYLKSAVQN
jgi:hypothetical protein